MLPPIHFKTWIEDHRHLLKPPVGNQVVYEDTDFMIMVVGGPNSRTDFHVNQGEEFFYQVEGDINLIVMDQGERKTLEIHEGDIFLLPPNMPHSPQRGANTVGLVIEKKRQPDELDGFQWYCDQCDHLLFESFFHVSDIVAQLPPIFEAFFSSESHTTCSKCGTQHQEKGKAQ